MSLPVVLTGSLSIHTSFRTQKPYFANFVKL
nr:MAG TPA: hypothetical protein [Caudoviricetes sp.]